MHQPTSFCSQPDSVGLWQGQAGSLTAPSLPICCSKPSTISSAARKGPETFNDLLTKIQQWQASGTRGGLAWPQQQLATRLLKTFGSRSPKGQPSPAPSLPNHCQDLAASAFKHNRCKASTSPRVFISLERYKFGWGDATRGNLLKQ